MADENQVLMYIVTGQTYRPLSLTESSFSWHALLPLETFVAPHVHATQGEFILCAGGPFQPVAR